MRASRLPPFAPPFSKRAAINTGRLKYSLVSRWPPGPSPTRYGQQAWAHQLHSPSRFRSWKFTTPHPLGSGLYYEEPESWPRSGVRRSSGNRLPKFLNYFERILDRNSANGPWMVGTRLTYVDLSMAQIIAGCTMPFPQ